MKKPIKVDPQKLKLYRDILVTSGNTKISNLQVRTGLPYKVAKNIIEILNKDKKLAEDVFKYQSRRVILLKKYIDKSIELIKVIKDKDYINWFDVRKKAGIKYEFDRDVRDQLKKDGYLSDVPVYLIKKRESK